MGDTELSQDLPQEKVNQPRGSLFWVIPDGYIPPESRGELVSHESICVLNCENRAAKLSIDIYFEDREPLEGLIEVVEGRRTRHIRTASLEKSGERIPTGIPYAITVTSDVPVIIQYSRLDTTQPELALMSVIAYPV
ncbi:sensory rhodopsin transducer [Paenibacillus kribbensis]|uniref:sensory rhodopsin transducer n=1 Tax=Paenibacillus kribbensis TaxID=172713 RepID=UPI002DBB8F36|nr:sensory rhodopsin transducer [Paenibacillus kribbensis]MEC0234717.1 sensory rhodopsin transducer [Paenibacillus kribbensis]